MQKVLGDRNKDPRLFLLFQYFQPPTILFAELRPYTSLPAKLTDKLTLQGSWFAEIADPTKSFSAAAQNMTRLVSVLGEERARCLWQVFFFPNWNWKLLRAVTLGWSGLLSTRLLVFYAMHLWHRTSEQSSQCGCSKTLHLSLLLDIFFLSIITQLQDRFIPFSSRCSQQMNVCVILSSHCDN